MAHHLSADIQLDDDSVLSACFPEEWESAEIRQMFELERAQWLAELPPDERVEAEQTALERRAMEAGHRLRAEQENALEGIRVAPEGIVAQEPRSVSRQLRTREELMRLLDERRRLGVVLTESAAVESSGELARLRATSSRGYHVELRRQGCRGRIDPIADELDCIAARVETEILTRAEVLATPEGRSVSAPEPPLLGLADSLEDNAIVLANMYDTGIRAKYGVVRTVSCIKVGKNRCVLQKAAESMLALRIAPARWLAYSLESYSRAVPSSAPTVAWTYSANRLAKYSVKKLPELGLTAWVVPVSRELSHRYRLFRAALPSLDFGFDDMLVIHDRFFGRGMRKYLQEKAERQVLWYESELMKDAQNGIWVWY